MIVVSLSTALELSSRWKRLYTNLKIYSTPDKKKLKIKKHSHVSGLQPRRIYVSILTRKIGGKVKGFNQNVAKGQLNLSDFQEEIKMILWITNAIFTKVSIVQLNT